MADIKFPTLAFAATGAPTPRTMPIRLNDVINVLDWGADPTGGVDSRPAIQAAINYAYTLAPQNICGTPVFLPPGTYLITTPPLVVSRQASDSQGTSQQGCLEFFGAGRDATIIKGKYDGGFLVQKTTSNIDNLNHMHDLTIWNQSVNPASGAYYQNTTDNRPRFANIHFIGFTGYGSGGGDLNVSWIACIASCTGSAPAGSVGFNVLQGEVMSCQATGFEKGFLLYGDGGIMMYGSKATSCTIGAFCGIGPDPGHPKAGIILVGNWFQDCGTGISVDNVAGGTFIANVIAGTGATGIKVNTIQGGFFGANTIPMTVSNLSFDAKGGGSFGTQNSCVAMAMQGPGGFAFPDTSSNSYSNGRWEAIQCGSNSVPLQPWVLFGTLSTNSYEGKEYNIIDAQAQASFGGVIAGGGSGNRYKIRYDGTNWIRVA